MGIDAKEVKEEVRKVSKQVEGLQTKVEDGQRQDAETKGGQLFQ